MALQNLKTLASERGVDAMAYFEEGTPESVLALARKKLGDAFVFTFPAVSR